MKIRLGFVSNSSTASFIIATKEEVTHTQIKKKIIDYFRRRSKRLYIPNIWPKVSWIRKAPRIRIDKAVEILTKIQWECVMESPKEDNPVSYRRERPYYDKGTIPYYDELKRRGFKYFYEGSGVDAREDRWLFGLKICSRDLDLYVDSGY